jgi:hypothetical protein
VVWSAGGVLESRGAWTKWNRPPRIRRVTLGSWGAVSAGGLRGGQQRLKGDLGGWAAPRPFSGAKPGVSEQIVFVPCHGDGDVATVSAGVGVTEKDRAPVMEVDDASCSCPALATHAAGSSSAQLLTVAVRSFQIVVVCSVCSSSLAS